MLATSDWPQFANGVIATMGILGVVISGWYGITRLRNGGPSQRPAMRRPPPTFPWPKHEQHLVGHDQEIVELRRTDERQWDTITEQGKLQAEMKGTLDGVAQNVDRLVEKLL